MATYRRPWILKKLSRNTWWEWKKYKRFLKSLMQDGNVYLISHLAGHYLSLEFSYDNPNLEFDEVTKRLHACIAKLIPNIKLQEKASPWLVPSLDENSGGLISGWKSIIKTFFSENMKWTRVCMISVPCFMQWTITWPYCGDKQAHACQVIITYNQTVREWPIDVRNGQGFTISPPINDMLT